MERFFSLKHLSQEQLHDLYHDAIRIGKQLVEYDKPGEVGYHELALPEDEIVRNIVAGDQNYIVFNEDNESNGFPDSTSVVFPLAGRPYVTAYIDIDNSLLDWFAEKYSLTKWWQVENGNERNHYPFTEFYTHEPMKRHRLN